MSESESLIQRHTDVQGLSTAILLPSLNLLGGGKRQAVDPLTPIVGVGLFQRTVLTLQRAGIRQLIVLVGSEEEPLKQSLGKGPRVTVPVRWMPIREFPLDDSRTWESLAAEVRGFCLLSSVATVFSRHLIEQLRRDVQEGQAAVVVSSQHDSRELDPRDIADLVVVPAAGLQAAGRLAAEIGTMPIGRWLQGTSTDGRLRRVAVGDSPSHWYQSVTSIGDVQEAERRLFQSLKSDFEGFVDRYFNRKLSRWFTKVFLAAGLSPNTITVMATIVGFCAAVGFSFGTYGAGVVSALLFQLAAVIDCSDGEVARLTFTESPFGAWLDIALDNVVHMAIFAGIAGGAYAGMMGQKGSWVPLALGAAAIAGNICSFILVNRAQHIKQASEWKTPVQAAWSDFMLQNVASRDFSIVVLAFALLGKLDWFLWMAAVGSVVFAVIMVWVVRPSAVVVTKS